MRIAQAEVAALLSAARVVAPLPVAPSTMLVVTTEHANVFLNTPLSN